LLPVILKLLQQKRAEDQAKRMEEREKRSGRLFETLEHQREYQELGTQVGNE